MTITVRTNLPEFKREMERLGRDFIPVARAASRAAAVEFAKAIRRTAPRDTGRLRRAVVIKRARKVSPGMAHYIVGIRQGKGAQRIQRKRKGIRTAVNLDAFYWRFLEGGWTPRKPGNRLRGGTRLRALRLKRERAAGGRVVKHKFILPAFQSSHGRALSAFYAKLESESKKLRR